jgi:hypothetical protein
MDDIQQALLKAICVLIRSHHAPRQLAVDLRAAMRDAAPEVRDAVLDAARIK